MKSEHSDLVAGARSYNPPFQGRGGVRSEGVEVGFDETDDIHGPLKRLHCEAGFKDEGNS